MFWKILDTLKLLQKKHKPFKRVLDVGSRNINGSVRDVLVDSKVIGIDFIEGKDVDVVMDAHDLTEKFPIKSFDLVTCCEMLEHDKRFWITVKNMRALVKPGGYLFITVPGINFFKHDFPADYYRFTEEVFTDVFFKGWEDIYVTNYSDSHSQYVNKPNNLMGWARRPKR